MDKLYIATSSLNFNNILATESISPEAFYGKRNFGYKRFTKVAPNPFANSIIAYNKVPVFEIEESDYDDYPLIIEISSELLRNDFVRETYQNNRIKIYQLNQTIYLHPDLVKFLFLFEKALKTTMIKAEPSIETKLLPVYSQHISVIDKDYDTFKWDKSFISKISDLPNKEVSIQTGFDSKLNKLKGFYYSYLLGLLISSSFKERTPKEEFTSITQLIIDSFDNKETLARDITNLNNRLENFRISIEKTFENRSVSKEELVQATFLDISNFSKKEQTKLIEFLKTTKPRKWTFWEQLEWDIEQNKNENNVSYLIKNLQNYLKQNYLKTILHIKIERIARHLSKLKQKEIRKTDALFLIDNINFKGYQINRLSDSFFEGKDADLFKNIVNELLKYSIHDIQTFKEEKINLTIKIGSILKQNVSSWENSQERYYFNSLLDNIENYQPFELKSHASILLQSIALFIQKGEEPQKLIDSLLKNQLSDYRIALGLWGSIFGFSALPKTLTNILFEKENIEKTQLLYKDIQTKLHNTITKSSSSFECVTKQIKNFAKQTDEPIQRVIEKKVSTHREKLVNTVQPKVTPKCPLCDADMEYRKKGNFYGCSNYQKTGCKGNRNIPYVANNKKNNLKVDAVNISEHILAYIRENKTGKILEINNWIKEKDPSFAHSVSETREYIKNNLSEELELIKKEESVKQRQLKIKGV